MKLRNKTGSRADPQPPELESPGMAWWCAEKPRQEAGLTLGAWLMYSQGRANLNLSPEGQRVNAQRAVLILKTATVVALREK